MDTLAARLNYYACPPGRRIWALRLVAEKARALGFEAIADHCNKAIEHDIALLDLKAKRLSNNSNAQFGEGLGAVDGRADSLVAAIHNDSKTAANLLGDEAAQFLLDKHFAGAGSRAIILLSYPEQAVATQHLLDTYDADPARYAHLSIPAYIEKLRPVHAEYQRLLKDQREEVSADQIRQSDAIGQENLAKAIIMILAATLEDSDEARAAQSQLMQPIDSQNEALRRYYKRRRQARDVNPETGTEVDEDPTPIADAEPGAE